MFEIYENVFHKTTLSHFFENAVDESVTVDGVQCRRGIIEFLWS